MHIFIADDGLSQEHFCFCGRCHSQKTKAKLVVCLLRKDKVYKTLFKFWSLTAEHIYLFLPCGSKISLYRNMDLVLSLEILGNTLHLVSLP